jgi:hypothetical protein
VEITVLLSLRDLVQPGTKLIDKRAEFDWLFEEVQDAEGRRVRLVFRQRRSSHDNRPGRRMFDCHFPEKIDTVSIRQTDIYQEKVHFQSFDSGRGLRHIARPQDPHVRHLVHDGAFDDQGRTRTVLKKKDDGVLRFHFRVPRLIVAFWLHQQYECQHRDLHVYVAAEGI